MNLEARAAEELLKQRLYEEGAKMQAQCAAPKPWAELSIEEKIERLREQVKHEQAERRYIYERLSDVQRQVGRLNGHTHDSTGRPVVGIYDEPKGLNGCCEATTRELDPSKVYF